MYPALPVSFILEMFKTRRNVGDDDWFAPAHNLAGSIAANIRIGRPDATDAEVQAAAIDAAAADFIAAVEVAPPGFINFRLSEAWLTGQVVAIEAAAGDDEAAQFEAGVTYAARQVEELIAAGHRVEAVVADSPLTTMGVNTRAELAAALVETERGLRRLFSD